MSDRLIEVTYTRKGTWYLTAPCGWYAELPGECESKDIKTMAYAHKAKCCKSSRICVETVFGYRKSNTREKAA